MSLNRLRAGDPLNTVSASTWNKLCDVAERALEQQVLDRSRPDGLTRNAGVIRCVNRTNIDLPRYSVVGLAGVLAEPDLSTSGDTVENPIALRQQAVNAFQSTIVMEAWAPDPSERRVGITQEPIAAGKIGRVMVSGATAVRIRMGGAESTDYATTIDGETGALQASGDGMIKVFYVAGPDLRDAGDANDVALAYVLLGASRPALLPVKVKKDGGANGNATTNVSYTYQIWATTTPAPDSSNDLATGLSPAYRPIDKARYVYAPDYTLGLALTNFDTDPPTYELLIALGERLDPRGC